MKLQLANTQTRTTFLSLQWISRVFNKNTCRSEKGPFLQTAFSKAAHTFSVMFMSGDLGASRTIDKPLLRAQLSVCLEMWTVALSRYKVRPLPRLSTADSGFKMMSIKLHIKLNIKLQLSPHLRRDFCVGAVVSDTSCNALQPSFNDL